MLITLRLHYITPVIVVLHYFLYENRVVGTTKDFPPAAGYNIHSHLIMSFLMNTRIVSYYSNASVEKHTGNPFLPIYE